MSRRNRRCQYCGADLPENLLFTQAEIEAQNQKLQEEEKQRQARRKFADEEEARKKKAARAGTIILPTIFK